jgi:aminoglycoside phosphotransferase family enzyme/predicted kinase
MNGTAGAGMPDMSAAACYPHPVGIVRMMETHISRVYLTGEYAYKLKKPVALGFLDFTTLDARRQCCENEVRLNRRLAPRLYLDVVPIHGPLAAPRIAGSGPVIDYAVRMLEFPQEALASAMLARGTLTADALSRLAQRIAIFHENAPSTPGEYGTHAAVQASATQNFEQIAACLTRAADRAVLDRVRAWTATELHSVHALLQQRHDSGCVREVHGDLHLGNIVCMNGELVPFDCIEFNAALRWNDVLSEAAFVVMDLHDRNAPRLADLFIDAYLAHTGDYEGLPVLRFFVVYRAVVRAKIHLMRAMQITDDAAEQRRLLAEHRRYMRLAVAWTRRRKPFLIIMHGLAASGKSTFARELLQAWHAIRVRSDVERKRLAGMSANAATLSPVGGGVYSADRSDATYARMATLADAIMAAGYPAIVDATFIRRAHRERLAGTARARGLRWAIIHIDAPVNVLRRRLVARTARGGDPSEATPAVLERQLEIREPLTPSELRHAVTLDGEQPIAPEHYAAIADRIGVAAAVNQPRPAGISSA